MSGITSLRSAHLEGLLAEFSEEQIASPMRELLLNNTGIDDAAAPFISTCRSLQTLEVGGTKLTSELPSVHVCSTKRTEQRVGDGLYCIIDACPRLERLDLTSCRGVPVAQRRNFFEASPSPDVMACLLVNDQRGFSRHITTIVQRTPRRKDIY